MNVDVSGKSVVITGSSRGIGREMVLRFATEGANVVINYLNSEDKALKLYDEISTINASCILIKADVTKQNDVNYLYDETIKRLGTVDILINNAGVCSDNIITMMTKKQWDSVIDINLSSVFLCSKVFSKHMIKKREGKIINIASLKGQLGSEGQTNYCTSKAGIIGFTKALAKDLGRFNISANAVCPGFIVTDLNRHNENKKMTAQKMSVLSMDDCLNSLLDFIIFMSSDRFQSVSGQVFNIDSRIS